MTATTICRSLDGATIATSAKKRSVTACWSNDANDHYKTAFVQAGIDTSVFARNPVILWNHGKEARGMLPIATATEWQIERYKGRQSLIGVSRFWEDDEFAEARFQDYASGRLKGWSINCVALDASAPTYEEKRARDDWNACELVYRETRLLEVSATPLPGNPSALTLSVERSAPFSVPAQFADGRGIVNRMSAETQSRLAKEYVASLDMRNAKVMAEFGQMMRDMTDRLFGG